MKPEIKDEDVVLAQLNVMSILYGREAVEASVDMALEYAESDDREYDVSVTMQFIAIAPRGTPDSEIADKTVFAIHVPSFTIFIDESGRFGPARSAKDARDELNRLLAAHGQTEPTSDQVSEEPKNVISLKNSRRKTFH